MSEWKNQDFSQLTVLELRKVAKAMGVQLGAGISKAGIVEKLDRARNAKYSDIPAVPMDFTPIPRSDDKQESPARRIKRPRRRRASAASLHIRHPAIRLAIARHVPRGTTLPARRVR